MRVGTLVVLMVLAGAGAACAEPGGFDADAATRAYLATVNGAARVRSDAYFEGGYLNLLWGALVTVAVNLALLVSGVAARLSAWGTRVRRSGAGRTFVFGLAYGLLTAVLTLPWTLWLEHYREHAYGMSNQTLGAWAGEWAIGLAIGTVVAAALYTAILSLVRRRPGSWWAWGTGVVGLGAVVMIVIAPVAIQPLFNRYTALVQEPLRTELLGMARANGVPVDKVLVQDASRQTKRVSANVSGLGGTARVALNDNLLATRDDAMIRSVMGHEMGHYLLGHTFRLLTGAMAIVLAMLWLVSRVIPVLLRRCGERWGVGALHDPAILPLAAIVLVVAELAVTPIFNTLVRTTEAQADIYGLNAARAPDGFARAALKLGEYRKLEPTALEEAVFFDHPSGRTRIAMAMRWKAEHMGQADVR